MRAIRILAANFCFFLLGGLLMLFDMWPMAEIRKTTSYYFSHSRWVDVSPMQVIYDDLNIYPHRKIAPIPYTPPADRTYEAVEIRGMRDRRTKPLVFVDPDRRTPAYTMVAGLIDTTRSIDGVLLLGPDGDLVHQWELGENSAVTDSTPGAGLDVPADNHAWLHGLEVFPDGSIIAAFHNASVLTRFDACGAVIWRRDIAAHHSVVSDGAGHVWTWDGDDIVRVRASDGEVAARISLRDLAERAPGKYLLTSRRIFSAISGSSLMFDPLHANDAEPLPPGMASAFPMFDAGDLVVSLRSGNLVFVLDPDSEDITWWMHEGSFAQHDPDWLPDGGILVFDNNTDFGASRIIRVDPASRSYSVVLDGEDHDIYTDLMGDQQMRADGAILVNSSKQGRVVEVARDGRVVFEFLNRYDPKTAAAGVVTHTRTLPLDFFDRLPDCA